jgi:hypothetical protein
LLKSLSPLRVFQQLLRLANTHGFSPNLADQDGEKIVSTKKV